MPLTIPIQWMVLKAPLRGCLNGSQAERPMNEQTSQREQHLLKLLQEANRRIEELEAEKRSK